jgi:hypothetical protein
VVGVGILLYPAVWIYALWDAYKVAERQSDEEPDTVVERHVGSSSDEDETEESS